MGAVYDYGTEVKSLHTIASYLANGSSFRGNDKIAELIENTDKVLYIGGELYGAARQIYAALNYDHEQNMPGKYRILTKAEELTDIDFDQARFSVRYEIAPDMKDYIGTGANAVKPMAGPYAQYVKGSYIKTYFTTLETPIIQKPVKLLGMHAYDVAKEMKDSRITAIYEKEDVYWFQGCYNLIREQEALIPKSSIFPVEFSNWDKEANKYYIDGIRVHTSPMKRNQKIGLIVSPEYLALSLGKIDHTIMANISKDIWDNGFDTSPEGIYKNNTLNLADYRGLTFSPYNAEETLVRPKTYKNSTALTKEMELLEYFGYNIRTAGALPADRSALVTLMENRYGVIYDTDSGNTPDYETKSKFHRILIYSPKKYFGEVLTWERDIRLKVDVINDVFTATSDEDISFVLHNRYSVTAVDIWGA